MKTIFQLIAIAMALVGCGNHHEQASISQANDYTFTNGVVLAKIIGPNKWNMETAEGKYDHRYPNYFYTTIEVVSTKDNFSPELTGRKLKVRTGDFDKTFLNQTLAVHLIRRIDKAGKIQFGFDCSDLHLAMMVADWRLKKQK